MNVSFEIEKITMRRLEQLVTSHRIEHREPWRPPHSSENGHLRGSIDLTEIRPVDTPEETIVKSPLVPETASSRRESWERSYFDLAQYDLEQ